MYSVTQRIGKVKQPRGGYVPPKMMTEIQLGSGEEEIIETDFHAGTIGLAVDYLTRFMLGAAPDKAFHIALLGARQLEAQTGEPAIQNALELLSEVKGLDDLSITRACQLSGLDVCFRAGVQFYKPIEDIQPDEITIRNIRIMVERSIEFFNQYGPITMDGPTFSGGYTEIVSTGDGDFLTEDTIWDFKVSKKPPTNKHTLQVLMYYLMGKHSIHKEFDTVQKIGFFNPRSNTVYQLSVDDISPEIIEEVEREVIGYDE